MKAWGRILHWSVWVGLFCLGALLTAQDSPQSGRGDAPLPPKQDEQKSQRPQRVRVSRGVAEGLVVKKVPPKYPDDAHEQRIQGAVLLRVEIGADGNVESVTLVSGHPALAPSAIEAVKQWKYKPYLLNGQPVAIETQVQINFTR